MAKVAFSKLGIKKINDAVETVRINEIDIEVKRYVPFQEKLMIIGNALNNAADGNRFANPVKIDMYLTMEIIYAYTNISFTDKQKEDTAKLYDLFSSSGALEEIYSAIPESELNTLHYNIARIAEGMYNQMNSVYGIMENIAKDYAEVGAEAADIEQKLTNPNNLVLLKEAMKLNNLG